MTPEQTKEAEELLKSMEAGNNHPVLMARFLELTQGIEPPCPSTFIEDIPPRTYKYPSGTLPPWITSPSPGRYIVDISKAPEIPVKLYEVQDIAEELLKAVPGTNISFS